MLLELNKDFKIGQLNSETISEHYDFLICSAATLNSAKSRLDKRKTGILLVFDTPLQCAQIKSAFHLDLLEQKPSFRARYRALTPTRLNKVFGRKQRKIKIEKVDPIEQLMSQQLGSILNPISSFLYTVRDPEDRDRFKKLIYGWLISERKPSWLVGKAMRMGGYTKVPKALAGLIETVELGDGPRKAFRQMVAAKCEGKPVSYQRLSREHKVSTFDMRYTMSVVTSLRLAR
jgi:hypothetical protein